ncbi:hypothetical protein L2E82_39182 [Cichorium intybus]|uniref:Uncharacterized protein n=1 Tax=Cichorium intybus TaxID=13427 RepID=A0ACB9ALW9_CICIN|nr:hypothetical protein L2E82_39182 [Cichorium intybus]
MDHQWVKNGNRVSIEYVNGVKEFLNVARETLNSSGLTLCPCANCLNSRLQNIGVITAHLINVGIDKSYTRWVYHGEDEVNEEDTNEEDVGPGDFVNEEFDGLREGLEDVIGHQSFNIGPTNDLTGNRQPTIKNARYEKLFEALNNPLYEGCKKSSTLAFVVKLMNMKHDEDEVSMNDIFQEEESSELPPFQPIEELPETSLIVRNDVEPETLAHEAVQALRNEKVLVHNSEDIDDEYDDDDGRIFLDNEPILDSESDDDSDDPNRNNDDDDSFA